MTFVAMLRGINVAGQNLIKMKDLRELLEGAGLLNVQTYVQSGNIVFQSKESSILNLSKLISGAILSELDLQVPTLIRTPAQLGKILKSNPFLKMKNVELDRLYVTFLNSKLELANIQGIEAFSLGKDEVMVSASKQDIYLHCPKGYGQTKMNNQFFEKKLKVIATTRNWNTIQKLYELSSAS